MKIMKKSLNLIILLLESAYLWTSSCLSILFLLSTLYPSKIWQKMWMGGQEMKISEKIVLTSCIFLFASVDMLTKRCLSISYFLSVMYSSQFWQKIVDRWTSNENYEKKFKSDFFIAWKCVFVDTGQVVVFLFYFFFLPCTLQNFDKKVWTGGQELPAK